MFSSDSTGLWIPFGIHGGRGEGGVVHSYDTPAHPTPQESQGNPKTCRVGKQKIGTVKPIHIICITSMHHISMAGGGGKSPGAANETIGRGAYTIVAMAMLRER